MNGHAKTGTEKETEKEIERERERGEDGKQGLFQYDSPRQVLCLKQIKKQLAHLNSAASRI